MISDKDFLETKIGQRVCTVTEPGQAPISGLCEREGNIVKKIEDEFGRYFMISFDDGNEDTMHNITTTGIGFYLMN